MNSGQKGIANEEHEWLIEQLFKATGFDDAKSGRPFRLLDNFSDPNGTNICGGGDFSCTLSDYYEPGDGYDEWHLEANKVRIWDEFTDNKIILDEKDFYHYIEKYSLEYAENSHDAKITERVLACLEKIRARFKVERREICEGSADFGVSSGKG